MWRLVWTRIPPKSAPLPLHYTLANGKSDSSSGNSFAVEPLECHENLLVIFRVDSYSVVRHRKFETPPFLRIEYGRHLAAAALRLDAISEKQRKNKMRRRRRCLRNDSAVVYAEQVVTINKGVTFDVFTDTNLVVGAAAAQGGAPDTHTSVQSSGFGTVFNYISIYRS